MIKYKKRTLPNGLRVIVAPMENTQAVTLLVSVGVGSRYETKDISGISHFLEHLFFKGTKNRSNPGQIHKELDKMGASHNAFTSKEVTRFWVKSSVKDFDKSLDILSDLLLNPIFKEEEIEKERGVISQEIAMYEDMPQRRVWEKLENLFLGDQPLGWDIAGDRESVSGIGRDDIVSYRHDNYLSKNMTLAVAGNINTEIAFKKIETYFGEVKKGENKKAQEAKFSQKSPNVKIFNKKSDQTHLAMAVKSYDWHDERKYPFGLLSIILGGNTSSRLFSEIRDKLGLCYYVFSSDDLYSDIGYLGIGAGVSADKLNLTVERIFQIVESLKEKGVSAQELEFAKSFIRGKMALSMETSDEVAAYCAEEELFYDKIVQPEEELEKIEKVTQSDILKVAEEIFVPNKINLAVVGQHNDLMKKEEVYKKLFSKI